MGQSKLISVVLAKLKIAYPYYFKDLSKEDFLGLVAMYQEQLSEYNEVTLLNAIKSIIKQSKFMPSIKDIIDECESSRKYKYNIVIEKMKADGYFKDPSEIDKTYRFVEKGIIPDWLLEDMKKYGYDEDKLLLENNDKKMLTGGGN